MPVEVETGPLAADPVADGASAISLARGRMSPGQPQIITLDVDPQRGFRSRGIVSIRPRDHEGTHVILTGAGLASQTRFGRTGHVGLGLPDQDCSPDTDAAPATTPIS